MTEEYPIKIRDSLYNKQLGLNPENRLHSIGSFMHASSQHRRQFGFWFTKPLY